MGPNNGGIVIVDEVVYCCCCTAILDPVYSQLGRGTGSAGEGVQSAGGGDRAGHQLGRGTGPGRGTGWDQPG